LFVKFLQATVSDIDLAEYMGATETSIREKLPNGDQNPDYNHTMMLDHAIWTYICSNGKANKLEDGGIVSTWFSKSGLPRNAKLIPRKIYEDWLSVFKLT